MEIWNHFTFRDNSDPLVSRYIKENGINYSGDDSDILHGVDISENDPHWPMLKQLLKKENNSFTSQTKFSKEEKSSADWLTVRSMWYYDYPQPENKYSSITYTKEYLCSCEDCGIGKIQKDSFRFKRTPKWGKRNFCMTNWVYDELFVSSKAKELLDASNLHGFSFLEVKNKSGKETLPDIYQLQIPYVLPEGIADYLSCIRFVFVCPVCEKQQICSNSRGQFVFYKDTFLNAPDFVKTGDWFASGKKILVSQKAYRFITENKLDSSLVFEPIKLV